MFLCGLVIIVLRIAQYHLGLRTSNSPIQTLWQHLIRLSTLETFFSYILSAWLFSQIYLLHQSAGAQMDWITYYNGDRPRLNEKPLYLTTHLMLFGALQAGLHLVRDTDRLSLGVVRLGRANASQQNGDPINTLKRFGEEIPSIAISSVTFSVVAVLLNMALYALLIRSTAWSAGLALFRLFYNLPKTNYLPLHGPWQYYVLGRCFWSGFLLSLIWMTGNTAFATFFVKEPLKNGRPLTSESKDPNGSLLNGLKSKKQSVKGFALWELAFVARDFEDRRRAIYQDIDRRDGPMWSQVHGICMELVRSLETRIDTYGQAPTPAALAANTQLVEEKSRLTPPVKQDPILVSTPRRRTFRTEVEKAVGNAATDPGQKPMLSPLAKKAMAEAKERLRTVQREIQGAGAANGTLREWSRTFLSSPAGWLLRQDFQRRLTAAVLGMPYGEVSLYVNAINSLSQLAVHSLAEDTYGNVQRDVPSIVRALTSTTKKLDDFIAGFPQHWTELTVDRSSRNVDEILIALREGLSELVTSFGPYRRDLRLSETDMRLAKEAAGVANQRQEIPLHLEGPLHHEIPLPRVVLEGGHEILEV